MNRFCFFAFLLFFNGTCGITPPDFDVKYMRNYFVKDGVMNPQIGLFSVPKSSKTMFVEVHSSTVFMQKIPFGVNAWWDSDALEEIFYVYEGTEYTLTKEIDNYPQHNVLMDAEHVSIFIGFECSENIDQDESLRFYTNISFQHTYDPVHFFLNKTCGSFELPQDTGSYDEEKRALVSIYDECGGQNWTNSDNWLQGDPCRNDWYGVTCKWIPILNEVRVSQLFLIHNGLTGKFPNIWNSFVFLETARLIRNNMEVVLPHTICIHEFLSMITMGWIPTTKAPEFGPLPHCLFNMKQFTYIYANNAGINGTIPPLSMFTSSQLTSVQLHNNYIIGEVPVVQGTINETYIPIVIFVVSENSGITKINPEIKNLVLLTEFDITKTGISDISDELCEIHLQTLRANWCPINGELPQCMWEHPHMSYLELQGSNIQGTLENVNLTTMSAIREIDISINNITGTFPDELLQHQYLESARVGSNPFYGEISLSHLSPTLNELDISDTLLSGDLILGDETEVNTGLMLFDASGCFFSSLTIYSHTKLKSFLASRNSLSGKIKVTASTKFDSTSEFFTPANWHSHVGRNLLILPELQAFNVQHNNLSGPIPCSLTEENIRTLLLEGNSRMQYEPCENESNLREKIPRNAKVSSTFVYDHEGHYSCPILQGKNSELEISLDPSYYDWIHCICDVEYYGVNGRCKHCEEGAYCPGGDVVIPLEGHFADFDNFGNLVVRNCSQYIYRAACNPGMTHEKLVHMSHEDFPPNSTRNEHVSVLFECAPQYNGTGCTSCKDGYYHHNGICRECKNTGVIVGLFFFVIFLIVVGCVLTTLKSRHDDAREKEAKSSNNADDDGFLLSGIFAIDVYHYQLVTLTVSFAKWIDEFDPLHSFFSYVFLLEPTGLKCLSGIDANLAYNIHYFIMWSIWLFALIFACGCAYLFLKELPEILRNCIPEIIQRCCCCFDTCFERCLCFVKEKRGNSFCDSFKRFVIGVLNFVYFPFTKHILSTFSCSWSIPSQEQTFNTYRPWVDCFTNKSHIFTVNIIGTILFVIYPLIIWVIVYKNRAHRLATPYRSGCWFYMPMMLSERLVVAVVAAFVPDLTSKASWTVFVLVLSFLIYAIWRPYRIDRVTTLGLMSRFLVVTLICFFWIAETASRSNTRGRLVLAYYYILPIAFFVLFSIYLYARADKKSWVAKVLCFQSKIRADVDLDDTSDHLGDHDSLTQILVPNKKDSEGSFEAESKVNFGELNEKVKKLENQNNTIRAANATLQNEQKTMARVIVTLEDDNMTLQGERATLKTENATLQKEKTSLKDENNVLQEEKKTLNQSIGSLEIDIQKSNERNKFLEEEQKHFTDEIAYLKAKIAEFETGDNT